MCAGKNSCCVSCVRSLRNWARLPVAVACRPKAPRRGGLNECGEMLAALGLVSGARLGRGACFALVAHVRGGAGASEQFQLLGGVRWCSEGGYGE